MFQCFWWKQLVVNSCPPDKQQTGYESVSRHDVIIKGACELAQRSCADNTSVGRSWWVTFTRRCIRPASEMWRFFPGGTEGAFSLRALQEEDEKVGGVTETKAQPWRRRWSSSFRSEANEALRAQIRVPSCGNVWWFFVFDCKLDVNIWHSSL